MLWTYNVRLLYLVIATLRSDPPERVDTAGQARSSARVRFVIGSRSRKACISRSRTSAGIARRHRR